MSQLECATRHPRAALLGGMLGGMVPWFARELAHGEMPAAWSAGRVEVSLIMAAVILGCAAFSMLTVYKFGQAAFGDARKAIGFVAAMEGVMLVSSGTTSSVALASLVAINAIANGCVIALAREATERRRAADARRSATRTRHRDEERAARRAPISPEGTRGPVVPPAPESPAEARGVAPTPRWFLKERPVVVDAEIVRDEQMFS
jgi:hypothetical protein